MPHASSARRRPSSALLALSLAALLAAPVAAPSSSSVAAACPVEPPPPPLRILYRRSERVVVARAGESAAVGGEGGENFRRTTFAVNESLKGDPGEKTLPVYHWSWPDNPEAPQNFRRGETLLLFLRRAVDQPEYGYEVVDMRRGAKRLSEEALKVYVKRIEELNWLNRQGAPDAAELAEWLTRCAEEPATRWEGAYELAVAQKLAAAEEETARKAAGLKTDEEEESDSEDEAEAAEEAEGAAEAEATPAEEASDAGESEEASEASEVTEETPAVDEGTVEELSSDERWVWQGTDVKAEVFRALNAEQQERLASALYGAEKLEEGELELVPVVAVWDGGRLAPFLLKQLAKLTDDPPYEAEGLMETVASLLKDRRLRKLAEKYSEDAPYGDYSADDEDSEGSDEEDSDAASSSAKADARDAEPRPTSAQVRGQMLRAFIAAAEESLNRAGVETASR